MRPLDFQRITPDESLRRARAFAAELGRRRSVRHFAPDAVAPEIIKAIVGAAATAPSGANKQPWHFVAVGDASLKAQIREAAEREERQSYEHRMPRDWLDDLAPLGTDWHKEFLEVAPWLIVVFAVSFELGGDGERRKHYYVSESVGIACGMLLSAAHRAGLATLTHTPSPMNFLAEILERPENERPYLLIPVGYPAADAQVPDIERKSLDEVLQWRA